MNTNSYKQSRLATQCITAKFIIDDNEPAPPDLIGGGILKEQNILLIGGQPKSGKSFLIFNLAISLATGNNFSIFKIDRPYKVLVFSAEGGYFSNRERIQTMLKNNPMETCENLNFYFNVNENLLDQSSYEDLQTEIEKYRPDIIILDPLVRFHNANENSADEMANFFGKLRSLTEQFNFSVILVHHQGKDESKGGNLRGSSVISGEYDSLIQIKRSKRNKNERVLSFDLRHSESPDNQTILFNPETFWYESEHSSDPINQVLKKTGPIKKSLLADELVTIGLYNHKSSTYKAIETSLNKNHISYDEETEQYSAA